MRDDRNRLQRSTLTPARGRMNPTMRTTLHVLSVAAVCLVASCSRLHMAHPPNYDGWSPEQRAVHAAHEMQYFAQEMDWVARELEEWGTLGISAPVVVRDEGQFAFDPNVTAKALYDENRTEGAVSKRRSRAVNVVVDVDAKKLLDGLIANPAASGAAAVDASSAEETAATDDAGVSDTAESTDSAASAESADSGGGDSAEAEPASDPPANAENAAAKAVGDFSESLGTFDSSKLAAINPRRRIRLTASDFWELNLHKFFSAPKNVMADRYTPVFITFTVSCRPGWRTSSGFAGVVETRVEYMYPNKAGDLVPLAKHVAAESILPVAGIYPAYDSQELNLRSSRRELRTFAAQLAANGELAAAKVFLEAADKREQDAETNTGLATVTGYSSSGQGFGYEFRPTFRALSQPGNRKTKPGFRLEPISFPAVAVALVDIELLRNRLRPRVEAEIRSELGGDVSLVENLVEQAEERVMDGLAAQARMELGKADGKRFQALDEDAQQGAIDQRVRKLRAALTDEKFFALVDRTAATMADSFLVEQELDSRLERLQLVFQTSHTWRPLDKPFATDIPVLGLFGRLFQPRLRESSFVMRLATLAVAFEHFDRTFCTDYDYEDGVMETSLANRYACESLRNRWAMLGSQAVNFDGRIELRPADVKPVKKTSKEPKILSVQPSIGWQNAKTVVVIHGKNFVKKTKDKDGKEEVKPGVERVVIGGVDITDEVAVSPNTVVATVPEDTFFRSGLKHDVTVVTSEGTATARGAIEFLNKKKGSTGAPAVTVTRDAGGRVTAISINPDAIDKNKDGDLLQAIRAILENENCCENVEICIKKPCP